jgi:hypothetical protein
MAVPLERIDTVDFFYNRPSKSDIFTIHTVEENHIWLKYKTFFDGTLVARIISKIFSLLYLKRVSIPLESLD